MCVGRALRSGDLYAGRALGRALLARPLGASWLFGIRPGRRADFGLRGRCSPQPLLSSLPPHSVPVGAGEMLAAAAAMGHVAEVMSTGRPPSAPIAAGASAVVMSSAGSVAAAAAAAAASAAASCSASCCGVSLCAVLHSPIARTSSFHTLESASTSRGSCTYRTSGSAGSPAQRAYSSPWPVVSIISQRRWRVEFESKLSDVITSLSPCC